MPQSDSPDIAIEQAARLLGADANYRVLKKVQLQDEQVFNQNTDLEPCGRLAVIDTETTGLNAQTGDRIIDIAVATCEYGRQTGTLYRIIKRYESLEDPEHPLSPEITQLTGITDEMVKGQRINEVALSEVLEGVGLIICHNAAFDRSFLEARYPAFENMHFGCSLHEIPWSDWNISSRKLEYLGFRFGLFHEAHRARADIDMLMALLAIQAPQTQTSTLSYLLKSARTPTYRIHAMDLPFEKKDIAKSNGYRWNDGKLKTLKAWWIDTQDEAAEREKLAQWGCRRPLVQKLTAKERYRSMEALAELRES